MIKDKGPEKRVKFGIRSRRISMLDGTHGNMKVHGQSGTWQQVVIMEAWHGRGCVCIRIIHTVAINKSPNFSGLTVCRLSSYSCKEPMRVFLTRRAFLLCPCSDSRIQAPSICESVILFFLFVCFVFHPPWEREKRESKKTH